MAKEPEIGRFLDDEEKALFELTESEHFDPPNELTAERLAELQQAAGAAIESKPPRILGSPAEDDAQIQN